MAGLRVRSRGFDTRLLLALLLSFVTDAHADERGLLPGLIAAPLLVPVSIAGKDLTLDSYVVRPDRPGRFPLVIMTHGTPGSGEGFFDRIARRAPISFNLAAAARSRIAGGFPPTVSWQPAARANMRS